MAARVIHAFGSGVCEALPVQLVNDIFFIHERGKRLGYYTGKFGQHPHPGTLLICVVCLCLGSTGPLYAGYMLAGGYSWRLYFYVIFAFACALFILAFIFVEETSYKREEMKMILGAATVSSDEKGFSSVHEIAAPERKRFLATLKPWSSIDKEAPFFMTMVRSFTYLLVPPVFWVITTYGIS